MAGRCWPTAAALDAKNWLHNNSCAGKTAEADAPAVLFLVMNNRVATGDHPAETAFGRDARLRSRWQLDEMRTAGEKRAGRFCVLIADKTPPDSNRRAAFLISRRYSLLAVERNRARRLFREAFRQIYPLLPPAVWVLFVPRQRMKNATLPLVMEDVQALGKQLGILPGCENDKSESRQP